MKPIKQLAWRRRATRIVVGDTLAFKAMLRNWIEETQALARLIPTSFPPLEFDQRMSLDKDDLLAAEVSLHLDPAFDVSRVRSVRLRRPYSVDVETVLVDVSRLPAL